MLNRETITAIGAGFQGLFKRALASADKDAEWRQIAMQVNSNNGTEFYPFGSEFPLLEEWVGRRTIEQLEAQEYALKNRRFSSAIRVRMTDLEDDNHGLYDHRFESAGLAAAEWPNALVYEALKLGESRNGYDSVPFFGNHSENGATVSNLVAGSEPALYLLDTSRPLKPLIFQRRINPIMTAKDQPDDDHVFKNDEILYGIRARGAAGYGLWQSAYACKDTFDATNLEGMIVDMMSRKNPSGSTLGIRPDTVVCGPERWPEVSSLLETQFLANGGSNKHYQRLKIIVTPHLVGA